MVPRDHRSELERLERLSIALDSAFRVPGTNIRLGLDALLGLVPGIGDGLALAPSAYIVWKASKLGAPGSLTARMAGNVALDTLIGSVPLIGDLFDVGFKANRRNVALLRKHLERSGPAIANEKGPRNRTAPVSQTIAGVQPTSSSPAKK